MSESVRILRSALDEGEKGDIILRGVIDPSSLHLLKVAPYQREVLPLAQINDLVKAFRTGSVPDVDLGMRGARSINRHEKGEEEVFYLHDPVFIIDGLQRVSAAKLMLQQGQDRPHLGATIHFNTTEPWERERFHVLNAFRTKLSPSVLLRNMRPDFDVVDMLLRLTDDKTFALFGKVCWSQRMSREHLLTARIFCSTVGAIHAHLGAGRHTCIEELVTGLQGIMDRVGRGTMQDNVRTFFDLLDACWGVKLVHFKEGACWMRGTFLRCLATVLSRHNDFWRGSRLFVETDLIRKIKLFPVDDPSIKSLASSGGKAHDMLYHLLVEHINSGKRTRRLNRRSGQAPDSLKPSVGDRTAVKPAGAAVTA